MEAVLGAGNGILDYAVILLCYGSLFVLMRQSHTTIELNFRKTFIWLYWGWSLGTFFGNYLLYLAGFMSFLPWLNNFLHTFVWIGLCLGFLYAHAHKRPLLEQFALFVIYSFIVKWAEHTVLGTWEHNHFFGIPGNLAYIVGWSLMDGLYPVLSTIGLKIVSKFSEGVIVPRLA
jgi:hypothetical protein